MLLPNYSIRITDQDVVDVRSLRKPRILEEGPVEDPEDVLLEEQLQDVNRKYPVVC